MFFSAFFFSVGLVSSPANGLWSWVPQQDPVLPLGWVPVQSSVWSQPAVLGDIPAQNLPVGATSPHTVLGTVAPASAAGTWGCRTAACQGPAFQALCREGLCHQIPEQWIQ